MPGFFRAVRWASCESVFGYSGGRPPGGKGVGPMAMSAICGSMCIIFLWDCKEFLRQTHIGFWGGKTGALFRVTKLERSAWAHHTFFSDGRTVWSRLLKTPRRKSRGMCSLMRFKKIEIDAENLIWQTFYQGGVYLSRKISKLLIPPDLLRGSTFEPHKRAHSGCARASHAPLRAVVPILSGLWRVVHNGINTMTYIIS
jgi:hypothetical protein